MPSSRFARIFGNPFWAVFALIGLFVLLFFAVPLYAAFRITLFLQLAVFIIAISLLAALGLFQRRRFKTLCAFLALALLLVMSAARITPLYDALKFQILAPRRRAAVSNVCRANHRHSPRRSPAGRSARLVRKRLRVSVKNNAAGRNGPARPLRAVSLRAHRRRFHYFPK